MLVCPSPNSQDHDVGVPVDVSAKETANGMDPKLDDEVNDATGGCIPVFRAIEFGH